MDGLRGQEERSLPALLALLDTELPGELAELTAELPQPDELQEPEKQRRERLVKLRSLQEVRGVEKEASVGS